MKGHVLEAERWPFANQCKVCVLPGGKVRLDGLAVLAVSVDGGYLLLKVYLKLIIKRFYVKL